MATSSLSAIQTKVRRLTRAPSESQLSTTQINEYINTFLLYDLPEHLRLFSLRKNLVWYTEPNVAEYDTNTMSTTNPLYDFKNKYVTTHKPMYVAGYEVFVSQSQEQFYALYPRINYIQTIGTGNNVKLSFTGTLSNIPILPGNVTITSIDSSNLGLVLKDVPVVDANGIPTANGNLYIPNTEPSSKPTAVLATNNINYITGAFTCTFPSAPNTAQLVQAQTVPYVASRPASILFFDNKFVLRPVPDKVYRVELEVYVQPTELLNSSDEPTLKQWWQYIAYGAAKKVFEDRMDLESVQQIMPEFDKQERMVNRRSIVEMTKERVATIYTEQLNFGVGNYWFNRFF